jgi:hypothetical protein
MVKYGQCKITCKKCGHGCWVTTEIARDKQWEYDIITQVCQHFRMKIDMYTNNSHFPWGPCDEIRFEAYWYPIHGGNPGSMKAQRSSCNDGHEYDDDPNGCNCDMNFSGNTLGDYITNTLAGVAGAATVVFTAGLATPFVVGGAIAGTSTAASPIVKTGAYLKAKTF